MVNTPQFKAMLKAHEETQEQLADAIGISLAALNARINGQVEFRASEINAIRAHYGLTQEETLLIFFS